jgi:hypothetical protein
MNTALNTRALAFAGAATGALAILACFTLGTLLGRPPVLPAQPRPGVRRP